MTDQFNIELALRSIFDMHSSMILTQKGIQASAQQLPQKIALQQFTWSNAWLNSV